MTEQQATPTPAEDQSVEMPYYWSRGEFHERLKAAPFKQTEANGAMVVRVNHTFFKKNGEDLVSAMVPEDLTLPTAWEVVEDVNSFLATKALSMLGQDKP